MSVAQRERVLAVLRDGGGSMSPRAIHRVLGGRYDVIQGACVDVLASGLVTCKEGGGNRRLYSLVTGQEATLVRRSRKLLAGVRQAGSLARSDGYRSAGVGTAEELDAVIERLVAEGLATEDEERRILPVLVDDGLSEDAATVLAGIRAAAIDGLADDQCADLLGGADARAILGQLTLAGLVVAHHGWCPMTDERHEGDGHHWWIATEFDGPDPGPDSPRWGMADKAALVLRRVIALGPQSEAALTAAATRAGLELRPGDVGMVALDIGLCEVNGLWRDDVRATNEQRRMRSISVNETSENRRAA